mmetsp:Transcript_27995/g.54429  ORF Transcript_27995/g.54429 Transcript_27995/m.54429 type:complete len:277 (-) Transcript_27995:315-1145(-)|eukprot:CAMPEP_0167791584 /NCGR_PEP_ID=MMETSP0111_2-20121227/12023_1 /TAXON_ID=91324 /ORGANISM="Lotharella globosa, Strain CCCM811" /LENGTH=276 /DNA_ID=CAMNT_0007684281 /DNA_START=40 /DNA_END=870 /DNA_ORIENTATION=+
MGVCCSASDDRRLSDIPPSRRRSKKADVYRADRPDPQDKPVPAQKGLEKDSVGIDDEYHASERNALISDGKGVHTCGVGKVSIMGSLGSGGTPQGASKPNGSLSKPQTGSLGGSMKSIANNDPRDEHEEEIKQIMAALDRGGTKKEITELELRLSKMSRAISMDVGQQKPQRIAVGMLAPIQENHDKTTSTRKSGGAHAKTVHSSDISSDEDSLEESSSSDSEDHLSSPAYSHRGFPPFENKDTKKYSQTLKNEGAIDKLQTLTQALPKLKPYYVA